MVEKLKVKKLSNDAYLPEYSLDCDIAFDVRAKENLSLKSLEQKEVETGIAIQIPEGYVGLIRDRFGLVSRFGMHVIAGTIDPCYREELTIMLINLGREEVPIEKGMRVAQIVVIPVNKLGIEEVQELDETKRTGKKHGITGLK